MRDEDNHNLLTRTIFLGKAIIFNVQSPSEYVFVVSWAQLCCSVLTIGEKDLHHLHHQPPKRPAKSQKAMKNL